MKALKIAIIVILVSYVSFSLINWLFLSEPSYYDDTSAIEASEGLELKSVVGLVKEVRGAQELERRLNEDGGVNNLDLDGNDMVDYIKVTEFGTATDGKIGYSMTVEPEANQVQEVATATVEKNGDMAEIQVVGNEQIYGDNAIFNDSTKIQREKSSAVSGGATHVYHSYFAPHPIWISPYYFGYYPSYYSSYRPIVGTSAYSARTTQYRSARTTPGANRYQQASVKKNITSPNKGKVANRGITRSLKKPTSTQKQFSTQAKASRSGGFGRSSSSSSSSRSGGFGRSSSSSSSSSSRSFSSFGK